MSHKKQAWSKDMPSGQNIMGMGGTGEDLNKPVNPKTDTSGKKLMKSNAQSS